MEGEMALTKSICRRVSTRRAKFSASQMRLAQCPTSWGSNGSEMGAFDASASRARTIEVSIRQLSLARVQIIV